MIALYCNWEGDLEVGPSGDIRIGTPELSLQQRIIRRLLTNSGDYIWHVEYGAGLGNYVGMPYSPGPLEALISNQLYREDNIAASPAPTVRVSQSTLDTPSTASVIVTYHIAGTQVGSSVALTVGS